MEAKQELLEIYKLHVEMGDRISQRRLQTNRFYISLISGLFTLLSLLINKETLNGHSKIILVLSSVLGIILCFLWLINIHSYRQLNSGKFQIIHDLEQKLSYAFYKKEWEILKKGEQIKIYFQLTRVEKFLPFFLMIPYILLLLFIMYCL